MNENIDGFLTVGTMIGPLFLGFIFSIAFEGILICQGYMYWRTYYNKDTKPFRSAVYALCTLELIHSAITLHAGYWYLTVNWGLSQHLTKAVWSITTELAITVFISFISRAFWIMRLYALSKNIWLTVITSIFSLLQLALGIAEVYSLIKRPIFSTLLSDRIAVISQMIAADVGDLLISASLTFYLRHHRTGVKHTELLLDRLILFVVTRGLLFSIFGAAQLISFIIWPTTFIFGIFHLMVSKVYTNSLLATLNARTYIATSLTDDTVTDGRRTGTSFVLGSIIPSRSGGNDSDTHQRLTRRSQQDAEPKSDGAELVEKVPYSPPPPEGTTSLAASAVAATSTISTAPIVDPHSISSIGLTALFDAT